MSLAVTAKPAPAAAPAPKAPADTATAKAAPAEAATAGAATAKVGTTAPATTASPGVGSAPIPFRKTAVTSGPEIFGTLVITLLVLAAFAAFAWYARRRGWLDRWITQGPSAIAGKRKLQVIEVLHVSRKTTLFRISDGEREMLLTESSVQTQLRPCATEGGQP